MRITYLFHIRYNIAHSLSILLYRLTEGDFVVTYQQWLSDYVRIVARQNLYRQSQIIASLSYRHQTASKYSILNPYTCNSTNCFLWVTSATRCGLWNKSWFYNCSMGQFAFSLFVFAPLAGASLLTEHVTFHTQNWRHPCKRESWLLKRSFNVKNKIYQVLLHLFNFIHEVSIYL